MIIKLTLEIKHRLYSDILYIFSKIYSLEFKNVLWFKMICFIEFL